MREAWALSMGRKNGGGGGGMLQGLMTLNEGKVHEADQGRWEKTGWKRGVCTDNGRGRGEERREVYRQDVGSRTRWREEVLPSMYVVGQMEWV